MIRIISRVVRRVISYLYSQKVQSKAKAEGMVVGWSAAFAFIHYISQNPAELDIWLKQDEVVIGDMITRWLRENCEQFMTKEQYEAFSSEISS